MPIRWTAETDQILLLKILETSAITVDVKKVAASWPPTLEAPTPRAISERLVRIRSLAKSTNGTSGHFAVSKPKPSTPKSSPLKITKARGTPKSGGGGGGKRKRSSDDDNDEGIKNENSASEASSPSKKKKSKKSASTIKTEEEFDEGVDTAFDDANDANEETASTPEAEAEEDDGVEEDGGEEEILA